MVNLVKIMVCLQAHIVDPEVKIGQNLMYLEGSSILGLLYCQVNLFVFLIN